jgi:hypothetical protein
MKHEQKKSETGSHSLKRELDATRRVVYHTKIYRLKFCPTNRTTAGNPGRARGSDVTYEIG